MISFFPLKYRFAAIITCIAGILLALIIRQGLFRPYERALLEQSTRHEVSLAFMEDICHSALLRDEYDVLQTYLNKLAKGDPSITRIIVADHRNIIIASTRTDDLGTPLKSATPAAGKAMTRQISNVAGLEGTLVINFSDSGLHEEFKHLIIKTTILSLAGLTALSLASLVAGSLLTRRLQDLTAGVQQVADGDLKVTVPETGRDEVMLLGTAINSMTRRIRSLLSDLQEQSERVRAITDSTLDALVTIDAAGRIESMNPAALKVFGCQLPLPGGFSADDILTGSSWQEWHEQEPDALQQLQGRHSSGRQFPVEAAISKASLSGHPILIASIRDISERKRYEDALTRLNQELEQRVQERTSQLEETNRELEAFSYSVSHDLRAPLRSISGFCLALEECCGSELSEEGSDYLRRATAAANRMSGLITDLLELSHLGKQALRRREADITSQAREVAADLMAAHPERQVEWHIGDRLTAWADEAMARVVLENLLGNAWKYTGKCEQGVITLERATSGDEEVFVVRDNGAGFSMEHAGKLFAPFQRLHNTNEFEGTGIGLATVQRIIHRHGGRIWAESSPGAGASFYFTFGGKQGAESPLTITPEIDDSRTDSQ